MTYEINKKRVARKIEDIRKSLDLTMPEFAERIGVTPGYLSTIFQKQLEKYFSKVFKKVKGCSPADYRKTNQNI